MLSHSCQIVVCFVQCCAVRAIRALHAVRAVNPEPVLHAVRAAHGGLVYHSSAINHFWHIYDIYIYICIYVQYNRELGRFCKDICSSTLGI